MSLPVTAADGRGCHLDDRGALGVAVTWEEDDLSPADAGELLLPYEALGIVKTVDRARKAGYRFTDLDTPGQMLGRSRSPRKAAAARANARLTAGHARPNRKPKVRPPVEPELPIHLRNREIRRRHGAGESLRDLGAAYQLSAERVRQICLER